MENVLSEFNPQQLFTQVLSERLKANNQQIKTWSDYKKRHEKVIEGLDVLPQDLSINCMVPIGKRALMPGKLNHTNEITVCLGDGYLAKYTAAQAKALCNRRIKKADEMLENLDKERSLYETRSMLPNCFDIFNNEDKKDFNEHWDDKKLDDWRREHREREKEYRQKLRELKKDKKESEIKTEDDLFKRLDALELQEELEDELLRLEAENEDNDGEDDEYYDESEVDSESYSSDYSEEATNEIQEKKSSKANYRLQVLNNVNTGQLTTNTEYEEKEENCNDQSAAEKQVTNKEEKSSTSKDNLLESRTVDCKKDKDEVRVKEKKVAFAEPQVKYFSNEEEMEVGTDKRRISVIEQKLYEYSKEDDDSEDESDEDDTIRIYFKHSEGAPSILVSEGDQIVTPRDIYKTIPGPKSILKKTPDFNKSDGDNVSIIDKQSHLTSLADESEEEVEHGFVYDNVVKGIKEHVPEKKVQPEELTDKPAEQPRQARPVSKFKLERAGLRK
ncbi:GSCOCG00006105001-RA-CDS [Cotesia congregata]|uniref:Similar to uri: Unconventional prefoldin RPB5 interactor-like protein (Drosophila melanogaster) n=1 Tax=Cotesia congregata TaxID=51543 RepID=A0A8J2MN60_COTCN|nr:GSCOCG00006105001-RA-CDS [Cotesia congregata]CAG5100205.1 Similar to uri: Unconventional prefoldin RPB5 interactor-like protein (Drosophila melanogaster) [Cotesia congregata]